MPLDPVELLRQLIQIPSVNPMGRDITDPHLGEARLTDFLQLQCERLALPWLRQRVHPNRENLLALVRGNRSVTDGGELQLWDVHQDTVPADGMTVDPFGGEVQGDRVYGRGACDVKGAMAAMLAAISRLAVSNGPIQSRPSVVIAFTINEECGFTGSNGLCKFWNGQQADTDVTGGTISAAEMFPRTPDAAIVAEPTDLNVVVAHQGVLRWRCHTIGRAAHTSRPDAGINAIYSMGAIVQAIERYHAQLQQTAPAHPLCGRPSICVSTIHGGVGVNTVPERATIEIDRRLALNEQPEEAYDELLRELESRTDVGRCRVVHDPPFMRSSGLSDTHNKSLAHRVAAIVQTYDRGSSLIGVPYATDAAAISSTGVPCVVFGPGSIAQAHTADEFIEIEDLQQATEIFHQIASEGLLADG